MVIRFACPSGHSLSAPDDRAGKPGNCPKCKTAFVVPLTGGGTAAEDDPLQPSKSTAGAKTASPPSLDDLIIFLCPNGHKLNGPKTLQGKAGQCPHCGARFQIPSYDEVDEAEHEHNVDDEFADLDDEFELDLSHGVEELPDVVELDDDGEVVAAPSRADGQQHALQSIIRALWAPRPAEAVLQIHLEGGEVLSAEKFSATLSQRQFGVFAVREADGGYTLTAIRWDAIRRIGVRHVKQLPGELFK